MVDYRRVQGIAWDFDGTLFDGVRLHEVVLSEILRARALSVPSHETFLQHAHGRLKDTIQELCGLEGEELESVYAEFIQVDERHYQDPVDLYYPDAIDLLNRAHVAGLKQIIVSNRAHIGDDRLGSPRNLAKRAPLAGLIDAVVCGDDNHYCKPDPRVLDAVEASLSIARDRLLVIGDQHVDAALAHNLDAQAVLVSRDGLDIPHLGRLPDSWRDRTEIVSSLADISLS